MSYVAYYRNALGKPCVRYIGGGFACTPSELPKEIKIRCGATEIPEWDWVSCNEHANVLIENAVSRGLTLEKG